MIGAEIGDELPEVVISAGNVSRRGDLVENGSTGFAADETARAAQGSKCEIPDSGVKKRAQLAAEFKARELAEKITENLLHHILGKVLAATYPASHPEHPFTMAVVKKLEGRFVTGIDASDQLQVGGLAG